MLFTCYTSQIPSTHIFQVLYMMSLLTQTTAPCLLTPLNYIWLHLVKPHWLTTRASYHLVQLCDNCESNHLIKAALHWCLAAVCDEWYLIKGCAQLLWVIILVYLLSVLVLLCYFWVVGNILLVGTELAEWSATKAGGELPLQAI